MSEREYKRVTQQLRPFITLFIVVVGSAFLASCGGGSGSSDPTATVSSAEEPNATAQAVTVSGGTVPGKWKGRAPTFVQRLISSDGGIPTGVVKLPSSGNIIRNHLYLNINPGITEEQVNAWAKSNGVNILGRFDNFSTVLVEKEFANQADYEAISQLFMRTGLFSSVEPELKGALNAIADPILQTQQGRWNFDAISLFGAWSLLPESAVGIPRIGIFDGGFRRDHEDLLFGSVSTIFTENAAQGTPAYCALDSNGIYLSIEACINADHGMHVAGVIGANGNNLGSSGVIRYASGTIDAYKFIDGGALELSDAIKKFTAKDVNIINVSYGLKLAGGVYTSSALKRTMTTHIKPFGDAIKTLVDKQYYMLIVQAAGNEFGTEMMVDGTLKAVTAEYSGYAASYLYGDLLDQNTNYFSVIKKYIQDSSLVVGAFYLDELGNRKISPGSSRPPLGGVDDNFILAPGGKFEWVKNRSGDFESKTSNTIISSLYHVPYGSTVADGRGAVGTSMAAPHVTGVAALIKQANDRLTIVEVKNIILSTSDTNLGTPFKDRKAGDGSDGYRYLNAEAAVKEAIRRKVEVNCGSLTSPVAVGQQGPNYTVPTNTATRFATTPLPKNGYPFGTYRWKTSEGTEILSTIEQANITFTTAGSGSVTVTPVLADGTVCTGSAATSSVTVTSLATTVFQDEFNGTALDLKKWTIQYFNGQPVTYGVSGGLLRLVNPGGSRGAAGITDGNMFIPNVSAVSGDFQVTISVQEVARAQAGSYKDSSGFRLQFGNTNIALFGNYNGYWFSGPYNSYKGHRFQASDPDGNLCLLDDSLDLNTMYTAELRIRRSGGIGYVGYRLAGKTAWTEKPCSLMALAIPNFVIASGDGGGTSQNGSFTGNVDRFEISTDPVLSAVIQVEANAPQGTTITVPNGVTSCTFNASGSWNYGNGVSSSANGVVFDTSDYVRLLGTAPWFSLIAKTSTGYIPIGSSSALQVTPGQSLAFMINEGLRAGVNPYSDNSGALSLAYNCN